jgi:hypothetical protein
MNGSRGIADADWKAFRELKPVARERFCERVLREIERLRVDGSKTAHQRYLEIGQLVRRRDGELAFAFDEMRRSTAVLHIARIYHRLLWSEAEFARFSPETRRAVETLVLDKLLGAPRPSSRTKSAPSAYDDGTIGKGSGRS